jgi:protein-tyrosine phosphatase
MAGYIDLHCHWVADIDDGVRTHAESVELLQRLRKAGFEKVIATPHMRPGLFENTRDSIQAAYERAAAGLAGIEGLPAVDVSSEHYFDDVVFDRLMKGEGLPYPGGKAVLIEFHGHSMPARVNDRLFDLRRKGLRPVLAHPERYSPVWRKPEMMEDFVDRGTVLLLDVAALMGKYGRAARRCSEELVDAGLYYAACSDAHRPADVQDVEEGIARLRGLVGKEEGDFLLIDGPAAVLAGKVDL